ncbi:MAG: methyltransferase domain-containing protein [Ktedonobacteraceae bacterium]
MPELSAIEHYYEDSYKEWQRLERHRMEFAVTLRALHEYLPTTPQAVLDNGGGPGRYSLALSSRGHQVTLLDLSQYNLHFAQQKAQEDKLTIHQYIQGNALNLPALWTASFDAVLLLGPLYHLLTESERRQAIREVWRVLRPGGLIFAVFITRYGALRDLAQNSPDLLLEMLAEWEEIIRTGIYRAGQGVGFTDAYFAHPAEIEPLMEDTGFVMLDLIGCEGIIARIEELVNQLTGAAWQSWVDLNYQLGHQPSLYGASDHLLYIGKKYGIR